MNSARPVSLNTPDLYPQKFDLSRDVVLLIALAETEYRRASFLDDRILSPMTRGQWVPYIDLARAMSIPTNSRPLHFIFHAGHVGSTLLSRLLDETGQVLPLREPVPLRTLADGYDVLEAGNSTLKPAELEARLETFLRLWSRGFGSTQSVVLKATSVVSRFSTNLMTAWPSAKAVYLNVRPETYLATLLAGANAAIDLKGHGPGRLKRFQQIVGEPAPPLSALSIGELAAVSWLVERLTQRIAMRALGARILAIDFDEMLRDLAATMKSVTGHLEIAVSRDFLTGIVRSPALTRYSKAPEFEYSPQFRSEILALARQEHADELKKGLRFLETCGRRYPVIAELL